MHYIRFLKVPKFARDADSIYHMTCLFTITTDLGESFYPRNVKVKATVCRMMEASKVDGWTLGPLRPVEGLPNSRYEDLQVAHVEWHAGIRQLAVDIALPRWSPDTHGPCVVELEPACSRRVKLVYLPHAQDVDSDTMSISTNLKTVLPPILGIVTPEIDGSKPKVSPDYMLRSLPVSPTESFVVHEAATTGRAIDPISSHVWDAAVALIPTLGRCGSETSPVKTLPLLLEGLTRSSRTCVLELGCGTGAVGCALGQLLPRARITMTDRGIAKPLVRANAGYSRGSLGFETLDWFKGPVSTDLQKWARLSEEQARFEAKQASGESRFPVWDVIIASDCTYNPDTTPALVSTITNQVGGDERTLVVVAMKTRHDSEAVFFTLMEQAGFTIKEQEQVLAPLEDDDIEADETEYVDVFVFGRQ